MSAPLYELSAQLAALFDAIDANEGVVTEEQQAALDGLDMALDAKVENVVRHIKNIELLASGAADEIRKLTNKKVSRENRIAWYRGYLLACLTSAKKKSVATPIATVSLTQASKPVIRWTLEPGQIPNAFVRVTYSLDGEAAHDYLKKHGSLPDGFEVNEPKQGVRIS